MESWEEVPVTVGGAVVGVVESTEIVNGKLLMTIRMHDHGIANRTLLHIHRGTAYELEIEFKAAT